MTIKNSQTPDATEVIAGYGNPISQAVFQQQLGNADYLGSDIFTDANGNKNTVDTGNTTALYDTINDLYFLTFTDEASGDSTSDPDTFTNPSNAFDSNDSTFANKTGSGNNLSLGKTFSAKDIVGAFIKADMTPINSGANQIILESFNGSVWSTHTILAASTGTFLAFEGNVLVNASVQGLRIKFVKGSVNVGDDVQLFTLEYGDADASAVVETNAIITDKVPKSIVVYDSSVIPTNTSITLDVSDDGGSTFAITGQSMNSYIDTSSFSGSSLAIKFNLATTDPDESPRLSGYGIVITDS